MAIATPRRHRRLLLPALLLAGTGLGCVAPAFELQGHRGARGLAPENTLAGFDAALAVGVTTLELDTVLTRDDVVVISHDPTLNPDLTRDADGRYIDAPGPAIRGLRLDELRRYDVGRLRAGTRYAQNHPEQRAVDGERIPTLAELFELVHRRGADTVRFNIETKISPLRPELAPDPDAFARALLDVARRHGMLPRIAVQSFDWRTLAAVQSLAPGVPTVYLSSRQGLGGVADEPGRGADALSLPRRVKAAGGAIWSPFHRDLDAAALREAHALGLQVIPWTVNERADIERQLDLGVDGIISDRPDRVRDALAARGRRLPRAWPAGRAPSP
jgi:glycerophosphoryl diester phosphodiesterase